MTTPSRLQGIPAQWLPNGIEDDVRQADTVTAMHAAVAEARDSATNQATDALSRLTNGDLDAVNDLLAATAQARSAQDALGLLPPVRTNPRLVTEALANAYGGVLAAGHQLKIGEAMFEQDMARWEMQTRSAGRVLPPPVVTDDERELGPVLLEVRNQVAEWRQIATVWEHRRVNGVGDPYELLQLAVAHIAAAAELIPTVDRLNDLISRFDALRLDAGLTWQPVGA